MNAVRSEVEELKEKIIRLEDTISTLQNENEVLKANVPSEVLRQISSTPTPQTSIQQQTASTSYQSATVNQSSQQSLPAPAPMAPSGNATSSNALSAPPLSVNPVLVGVQPSQASNALNPPIGNSAVAAGINANQPPNMTPSYVAQAPGTNASSAVVVSQQQPQPPQT